MPQSHVSKFADRYKRKSGGIDKRALRGLRRSLDRKQSRSELVGQRRKIMEASAMSPVDESRAEAATTKANSQQQPTKAGKNYVIFLNSVQVNCRLSGRVNYQPQL